MIAELLGERFNFDGFIVGYAVDLAFDPCPVHQCTCIPDKTGRRNPDMRINFENFLNRRRLKELGAHPLVNNQDNAVLCLDTYRGSSPLDCFAGILHLVEPAIGGKNGDRPVISCLILWLHSNPPDHLLLRTIGLYF